MKHFMKQMRFSTSISCHKHKDIYLEWVQDFIQPLCTLVKKKKYTLALILEKIYFEYTQVRPECNVLDI